jgi:flagellin-like hook-associated protein FlgL
MLQRMNELANQASNGTNSASDRQSIQDEISQLNTEIDRVAETTKFNELYLLKGDAGTKEVTVNAHDAGIDGTLSDQGSKATFEINLTTDSNVKIGGNSYHIYDDKDKVQGLQDKVDTADTVSINGTTYTRFSGGPQDAEKIKESAKKTSAAANQAACASKQEACAAGRQASAEKLKASATIIRSKATCLMGKAQVIEASAEKKMASAAKVKACAAKRDASASTLLASASKMMQSADKFTASAERLRELAENFEAQAQTASASGDNAEAAQLRLKAATATSAEAKNALSAAKQTCAAATKRASAQLKTASADRIRASADVLMASADVRRSKAASVEAKAEQYRASASKKDASVSVKESSVAKLNESASGFRKASETLMASAKALLGEEGLKFKANNKEYLASEVKALIVDGAQVGIDGSKARTAVDVKNNTSNKTLSEVKTMVKDALLQANQIGVDDETKVKVSNAVQDDLDESKFTYSITKGSVEVAKEMNYNVHVGADADLTNKISIGIETMNSKYLGIQNLQVVDDTGVMATYAIDAIEDAITKVNEQRSALGAAQNRLEHTITNLDNVVENTQSAESQIRDTDIADEMVRYSKNNILSQAGQSMLAQANQSTQGALSLLG